MTKRASEHQRQVLARVASNPGQRATAYVFNQVCGSPKSVLAMFRNGWVEGDGIPAAYVTLTEAGRAALHNGELRDSAKEGK